MSNKSTKSSAAKSQSAPQGQSQRLASLDLIRFWGTLCVLSFHFFFRGPAPQDPLTTVAYNDTLAYLSSHAYHALNLFFILSGFVIPWSAEGRGFFAYASARFSRIYPAFILCMSISFAVMLFANNPFFPVSWEQYFANWFIMPHLFGHEFMDGVYWTIIVEIVFYVWVGIIVATGRFSQLLVSLIAIWLLICCVNEFLLDNELLRMVFITRQIPYFLFGTLLYRIWYHEKKPELYLLAAIAFGLSFAVAFDMRDLMFALYAHKVSITSVIVLNTMMFVIFIAALIYGPRFVKPTRLNYILGGLTYPTYLLHQHIGFIIIEPLAPIIGKWAALVGFCVFILLFATAIHLWFERPVQKWLSGFFKMAEKRYWQPFVRFMQMMRPARLIAKQKGA